ncbi:DUF433 domain-containing protein [Chitinophaga solisilvae]|uniref:DUF433 domain-containing protein n=1 Tax=Chitinophaga solisilvae TaxID=1233460 RepID=UPI00136B8D1A|nr:DUF433 domain-containing protein [Chitinophaga solisilvae]
MDYRDYIESNINIMLGKPVIKGTRISVALVLQRLSEGATIPDLLNAYPTLTPAAINAVLAYASDVINNESIIAVA